MLQSRVYGTLALHMAQVVMLRARVVQPAAPGPMKGQTHSAFTVNNCSQHSWYTQPAVHLCRAQTRAPSAATKPRPFAVAPQAPQAHLTVVHALPVRACTAAHTHGGPAL